jgi:hypothetical protein
MQNKGKQTALRLPRVGTVVLFIVIFLSAFVLYRALVVELRIDWFFWVYYAVTLAVGIFYVIYNYGFSRHKLTKDLLPDGWTEEEKEKFLCDAHRRARVSRPALFFLLGAGFTFLYDALSLFGPYWFSAVERMVTRWFS